MDTRQQQFARTFDLAVSYILAIADGAEIVIDQFTYTASDTTATLAIADDTEVVIDPTPIRVSASALATALVGMVDLACGWANPRDYVSFDIRRSDSLASELTRDLAVARDFAGFKASVDAKTLAGVL